MSKTLRFILGDQLSHDISSLRGSVPGTDVILMCEVATEASYVPHHPKKIVFLFSAMRHFAAELQALGHHVDYTKLDDTANAGCFLGELERAVARHRPETVVVTFPGEWRVLEDMQSWQDKVGVPVEIREDDRFLCSRERFARHARERTQLRMEFFYRQMRIESGLLMELDDTPVGGQWNFDKENRKTLPRDIPAPQRFREEPDAITQDVVASVGRMNHYYGSVDGFDFAVTASGAERALTYFLTELLPSFGDYQDAMRGEEELFHSLLSAYINAGLLSPGVVCRRAEAEYRAGRAPLNAVEGFIRQILGWREFIRGVYWLKMPEYAQSNWLGATRPLPEMYWNGNTDMNCMKRCIGQTLRTAHAHHIQRLMVLGNFALLAALAPAEVEEWYLAVYIDAYDWVELPNVHGMVLFADGGVFGSKPYAASGKYIDRMSDYCTGCRYDVRQTTGPDACPFNFLYWDFIERNGPKLRSNPRMSMPYATLNRMPAEKRMAIAQQSQDFLERIEETGTDRTPWSLG